MTSMDLVGLNTKWYRYQKNMTQEQFASKTKFKMAYISTIENGNANLTCKNIDFIAKSLDIDVALLFNEETAIKAKDLPIRVDMYSKKQLKRFYYSNVFIDQIVAFILKKTDFVYQFFNLLK